MIPQSVRDRYTTLLKTIQYHNWRYHTLDDPEISDSAYDALVRELAHIELEYPSLGTDESPTQRVGAEPVDSLVRFRHTHRQWSFDNVYDNDELRAWYDRVVKFSTEAGFTDPLTFVCEQKIDGLKIVLYYENGELVRAVTRGDGQTGEDVTHSVRTIQSIPLTIPSTHEVVIIGEVWIRHTDLERINTERLAAELPVYANTRNLAAGSIRQLDPAVAASRNLQMFVYDIHTATEKFDSHTDELGWMVSQGFPVNPYFKTADSVSGIDSYYQKMIHDRDSFPFEIDGIVIKLDNRNQWDAIGFTAKSPRYAVAYKFPAHEATTVVEDITYQVGRTGILTPVAHVRPVLVGGVTVKRATLHNQSEIDRLGLMIGDTVVLERAGDVIPKITSVLTEMRTGNEVAFSLPDRARADGLTVRSETDEKQTVVLWYVVAGADTEQRVRKFMYAVSRDALDIRGLGEETVRKLVDQGSLVHIADLYELDETDFEQLEGFKEKSIDNVLSSIRGRSTQPLERILVALGIRHVGSEIARWIIQVYPDPKQLPELTREQLIAIHGVGPEIAESFVDWFGGADNQREYRRCLELVTIEKPKQDNTSGVFSGQVVVFTGGMETISRPDAQELVRKNGGQVANSINAKVTLVVAGSDAGSKLADAKKRGIPVITETEFFERLKL